VLVFWIGFSTSGCRQAESPVAPGTASGPSPRVLQGSQQPGVPVRPEKPQPPLAESLPAPEQALPGAVPGGPEVFTLPSRASAEDRAKASKILEELGSAYKKAEAYSDKGIVRVTADFQGQRVLFMQGAYELHFQRPNRWRLQCYNGLMVADGTNLWGLVATLPRQVLKQPAPAELTTEAIYTDYELSTALTEGPTKTATWLPLQLLLFLAQDPLRTLLYQAQPPELLPQGKIGSFTCDRVAIRKPDGALVLWIDTATRVLRRAEFPSQSLAAMYPPNQVKNVAIVADFENAQFGTPDEKAFEFVLPEGVEPVEVLTPPDIRWLGDPLPEFQAVNMKGEPLQRQLLLGKIVVIEIWATWCAPCQQSLPLLEQVHQLFKDDEQMAFWAFNIDQPEVSDSRLEQMFADLRVTVPIARDPENSLGNALAIEGVPTTVLVNSEGIIEHLETGTKPDMAERLRWQIERIRSGQSLHQEMRGAYNREVEQFRRMLAKCIKEDLYLLPAVTQPAIVQTPIAPRSEPSAFRMQSLWSVKELNSPGNIVVLPPSEADQPPRILVLEAASTAVQLDSDGKVLARHLLSDSPQSPVHYLRTEIDASGRRWFLGFASPSLELMVYDEIFQRTLVFPPDAAKNPHTGIADALLIDLTADGTLEMVVGYWNVVGVQGVELEGKRLWSNRAVTDALRLAVYRPGPNERPEILTLDSRGGLGSIVTRLDPDGHRLGRISVENRNIVWVVTADLDRDDRSEILVLTFGDDEILRASGVTIDGEILWDYELPRGIHQYPLDAVTFGWLTGGERGQWVIAAADGSLHILQADGALLEQFAYGKTLTGIAVTAWGGHPVLLVATPETVEAWSIKAQ